MVKKYLCIVMLLCGVCVQMQEIAAQSVKEWAVAINLSGRQRMLSQKMAKEFLLAKIGVDAGKNHKLQNMTMQIFDRTLNQLISGDADLFVPKPPNQEIFNQLNKVKGLWAGYKTALNSGDVEKVAKLNLPVLKNMNKAVGMYEKAATKAGVKSSGPIINVAGRQRMLTQKMSKEICLIKLNIDKEKNMDNLKATLNLFDKSHNGLINGNKDMGLIATTNKRTLAQMKTVTRLWNAFKKLALKVIATKKVNDSILNEVYKRNPILLKQMNRAVKLYEVTAK